MELTKKRFDEHNDRMDIVKSNCVYLKNYPNWNLLTSKFDEGAYMIDGGTVYISINGTDDISEAFNNAKVKPNQQGEHSGFAESGLELFYDLISCLGDDFRYYSYEIDAHSRGVPIAQKIAKHLFLIGVIGSINLVSTGGAPFLTEDALIHYKVKRYFTHSMVVTRLDIVPRLQGPRTKLGKFLIGLFGLQTLYHYYTERIVLPTVRFKLDHLAYRAAGEKYKGWEK